MSVIPTILSTRKVKSKDLQGWNDAACTLLQADFITTEAIPFDLTKVNEYLLFTSQNAVRSVLQIDELAVLQSKPTLCVGIKTKELLEQNGWEVKAWAHYAKDLAPILIKDFKQYTITFFSGSMRRDVLPDAFRANNIHFNEFKVYETVLSPHKISDKVDGLCFYSPSAIQSYLQLNTITDEVCFCIGDTTAEALKEVTQNIVLAEQPTVEATLQACVKYYQ